MSKFKGTWSLPITAVLALLLVFGFAQGARAQTQTAPVWAVLDLQDSKKAGGEGLGQFAADALRSEFAKLGTYELLPRDSIMRGMDELRLVPPLTENVDMIRLGQTIQAEALVTGRVADFQVLGVKEGKVADVLLEVTVLDIASGLTVNGAVVKGSSAVRPVGTDDSVLLEDAVRSASFQAVRDIRDRNLPEATVLNTRTTELLLNRGSRSGFKVGQRVILVRAREQVAEATVTAVEPDSSFAKVTSQTKGVRPGDRARVIFSVERAIALTGAGEIRRERVRSGGNNQGLVALGVLAILAFFLFGQGRSSSSDPVGQVLAEATITAGDQPAVRVSWTRDAFFRGTNVGPFRWQVWRNDIADTPVAVTVGASNSVIDDLLGQSAPSGANPWYDFGGQIGGRTCDVEDPEEGEIVDGGTPLVPGTPYQYSVELVYRINSLDLPGDGGGGTTTGGTTTGGTTTGGTTTGGTTTGGTTTGGTTTGGTTTGGTTTGGTTTGGTTTGGGGGDTVYCYFMSSRVAARGLATPLNRPTPRAPQNDQTINAPTTFQWTSVRGSVASVQLEYILQFSTTPSFSRGTVSNAGTILDLTSPADSPVSSQTIDTADFFPAADTVYWRVGVRNIEDRPGPVDNGGRYIYSAVRRFKRSTLPPGPP